MYRLVALFVLALTLPAQEQPQRLVYEAVIHDRGKTIGTTILLESGGGKLGGWIQQHDFRPLESGSATASGFTFSAGGNTYNLNTATSRIMYGGPDGSGDQRASRMDPVRGRIYRLTERADDQQLMTLQTDHGEQDFTIERPTIWKKNGPPIRNFERMEELVGKTVTIWRIKTGGVYTVEVIEEPAGMDILAKLPKEKKEKKPKR